MVHAEEMFTASTREEIQKVLVAVTSTEKVNTGLQHILIVSRLKKNGTVTPQVFLKHTLCSIQHSVSTSTSLTYDNLE